MDASWPCPSPRTEIGIKMRQLITGASRIFTSSISQGPKTSPDRYALRCVSGAFPQYPRRAVAFIDVASRGHGVVERAKFSRNALHGAGADSALSGNLNNALAGP